MSTSVDASEVVVEDVVAEEMKNDSEDVDNPLLGLPEKAGDDIVVAGKDVKNLRNTGKALVAGTKTRAKASYKIVFLGDVEVGKTSFISRFVLDSFSTTYSATVGIDFLSKSVQIDDQVVRLQIWDTAGQEKFRSLIPSYIRDASVAFVMYSVTDAATFLNVDSWVEKIRAEKEDALIILVANKIDCSADDRVVSKEEGEDKAKELGLVYSETSAKSGKNVKKIFQLAAKSIVDLKMEGKDKSEVIVVDGPKKASADGNSSCLC